MILCDGKPRKISLFTGLEIYYENRRLEGCKHFFLHQYYIDTIMDGCINTF